MKKLLMIGFTSLRLLAMPVAIGTILTGCTGCTTTAKQIEYKTLASVGLAVDDAMKAAANARHNNKLTAMQWETVTALHDVKFLPVYNQACDAASLDLNTVPTADLVKLATDLITTIQKLIK